MIQKPSDSRGTRIGALIGAERGVGASTLAAHLALILGVYARSRARTLLVDFSGQVPGAVQRLADPPNATWLDLVTPWLEHDALQARDLQRVVRRHTPHPASQLSQLDLLAGDRTFDPAQADRLDSYRGVQFVAALLEAIRLAGYEFALIDLGVPRFADLQLEALREASWVGLVTHEESGQPGSAIETFDRLSTRGLPGRRMVIDRRAPSRMELLFTQPRDALPHVVIPWAKEQTLTAGPRRELSSSSKQPHSPFVRGLLALARWVLRGG